MKYRSLLFAAAILLQADPSRAAEVTLDHPAPRLEGVTVGELLPGLLRPKLVDPWSATIDLRDGKDGRPVLMTVDMTVDDEPGVTFSMIYTEGFMLDPLMGIIDASQSGDPSRLPGTLDAEFAQGERCFGIVEQAIITCAFADKAGFQFSVVRFTDETPYDYARAKEIFRSIPLDRFAAIAGSL